MDYSRVAPTQIGRWTPMLRSVEAALGFPTDRGSGWVRFLELSQCWSFLGGCDGI